MLSRGLGRPVALLRGLGKTAHVFDDFAPTLAKRFHVHGLESILWLRLADFLAPRTSG